jgi:hypothetical protein
MNDGNHYNKQQHKIRKYLDLLIENVDYNGLSYNREELKQFENLNFLNIEMLIIGVFVWRVFSYMNGCSISPNASYDDNLCPFIE